MTIYPGTSLFPATTAPFPEAGGEIPPSVTTGAATNITATTVTLAGSINPNGLLTRYYWEFGPTDAYGSASGETVNGSGSATVPVSKVVSGTDPTGLNHYRLVAYSAAGFGYGEDRTFMGLFGPVELGFLHESGKGQY